MIYSNPEQTRRFIEGIPQHLHRLNYDEVKFSCNYNLPGIPICAVDFTNADFFFRQFHRVDRRNLIYRARRIENPDNRPFQKVSEISYVPDEFKHNIEWGRVNKPGQAMFYGALDNVTAISESITQGNVFMEIGSAMFVVGTWQFQNPLIFAQMPHSEKYFKQFYESVDYESESIQIEHIQKANARLKNQFEGFDYDVLQFFADEFARFDTENDYSYMLSNYYADRVFGRIDRFDLKEEIHGILYPSVTLSYQHKNLVLKPEVVNKHLKFVGADIVWMVKNRTGGADFHPMKQNVRADESGNLLWDTTGTGRW